MHKIPLVWSGELRLYSHTQHSGEVPPDFLEGPPPVIIGSSPPPPTGLGHDLKPG